jgi:hypothetical protein
MTIETIRLINLSRMGFLDVMRHHHRVPVKEVSFVSKSFACCCNASYKKDSVRTYTKYETTKYGKVTAVSLTMLHLVHSRFARRTVELLIHRQSSVLYRHGFRTIAFRNGIVGNTQSSSTIMGKILFVITFASVCTLVSTNQHEETCLEKIPSSGDIISAGQPTKESATGILFPPLCNGYYLAGTGVRVKWGLIKVYAVGTYIDPLAMSAVKTNDKAIQEALLDPNYPRTIRIVMNRALSIDKYTSAIVEALTPRMNGEDLDKLEEFKALNPAVDLVQGTLNWSN